MGKGKEDKEWAKRYILDPLTEPEPSQLDGLGSSFFNPRRSLSLNCKPKDVPLRILQRRHSGHPTPPDSASPTRSTFQIHHPKPFSPARRHSYLPPADWATADVVLQRSQSLNTHGQRPTALARSQSASATTQLPYFEISALQKQSIRRKPGRTHTTTVPAPAIVVQQKPANNIRDKPPSPPPKPAESAKSSHKLLRKSVSSPRPNKTKVGRKPPQTHHTQGTAEIVNEILADKTGISINRLPLSPPSTAPPTPAKPTTPRPLRRTGAFVQTATGKMTYQSPMPDTAKPQPQAEERVHHSSSHRSSSHRSSSHRSSSHREHRSSRSTRPYADTIDSLDRVGGVIYHHEGPYDATLAAVNKYKKKSPLEAVKDSNLEAIKATPPEYIQDSLVKHVPLQGTSIVPSGMPDRYGNVLHYEEGADLMREADAAGGAYRRYDFLQYHPDDLKGKGEPSYSIEKALKENKGKLRKHSSSFSHGTAPTAYEMGPTSSSDQGAPLLPPKDVPNVSVRRRSLSHSIVASGSGVGDAVPGDTGLSRSGSVSNRFADGIKRRFGSLRKK